MSLSNFHFVHKQKKSKKVLVLLHGTGADEHDLLPLAQQVAPEHRYLSLRGNVNENGMNRFFKRISFGVFDEENIRNEAQKLADFIQTFIKDNSLTTNDVTFLGFSNGANMILALLMLHPQVVSKAVLLHPMMPLEETKIDLSQHKIAISYGETDQMITPQQSKQVITFLENAGVEVATFSHQGGHGVTKEEVMFVKQFLRKNI